MGLLKKLTKPLSKFLDKVVPNEIKPALPYLSAFAPFMMGPGTAGAGGFWNSMRGRALLMGGANLGSQLAQEGSEGEFDKLSLAMASGIGALSAPGASEYLGSKMALQPSPAPGAPDLTMFQKAKNLGLEGAIKGADFISKSQATLDNPGFNLATLEAGAIPITQGTGDLARITAEQALRDFENQEGESGMPGGYTDDGRRMAIRSAMEAAGHIEEEILDALASLGLRQGGIVGLKHGGRIGFNTGGDGQKSRLNFDDTFSLSELLNPRDPQNELVAEHMQIGKLPFNITERILELNRGGKSYEDIAEITGVDIEDITSILEVANKPDTIDPVDREGKVDYDLWDDIVAENVSIRERPEHLSYNATGGIAGLKHGGQLVKRGPGRPGYGGPHETEAAGRSYERATSPGGGGGDAWQRQALKDFAKLSSTKSGGTGTGTTTDSGIINTKKVTADPNLDFGVNIGKGLSGIDLARLFNNYYKLDMGDSNTNPDSWNYGYGLNNPSSPNFVDDVTVTTPDATLNEVTETVTDKSFLDNIRDIKNRTQNQLIELGIAGELKDGGRIGLDNGGIMHAKRGFVDGPGGYAGRKLGDILEHGWWNTPENNEPFNQIEYDEKLKKSEEDLQQHGEEDRNFEVDMMMKTKDRLQEDGLEFGDAVEKAEIINYYQYGKGALEGETYRGDDPIILKYLGMTKAKGGRIGLDNGGVASVLPRGREMDYRGGGVIPMGSKERADDVPARLSKNEFVMTADAVRAAGGGSVNKGAKRMYNLMHKLEARV